MHPTPPNSLPAGSTNDFDEPDEPQTPPQPLDELEMLLANNEWRQEVDNDDQADPTR